MSSELIGALKSVSDIGVILPTYRESENIAKLIEDIENLQLNSSILVIDDSSPDNTAEIVKNLQKKYNNLLLYIRPKKAGLGTAITEGFRIFLTLKVPPKLIVTMDADYSHDPKAIPKLLSSMQGGYDIVIGSRYSKGGKITGWSFARKMISRAANTIARFLIGFPLQDYTSGFRCYSINFLKMATSSLHSQTYEIQIETIRKAFLGDFRVKEVPISFVNRKLGKSKLTFAEILGYLLYIFKTATCGTA
jgi:dolichol-phosphate mannosyltransferase